MTLQQQLIEKTAQRAGLIAQQDAWRTSTAQRLADTRNQIRQQAQTTFQQRINSPQMYGGPTLPMNATPQQNIQFMQQLQSWRNQQQAARDQQFVRADTIGSWGTALGQGQQLDIAQIDAFMPNQGAWSYFGDNPQQGTQYRTAYSTFLDTGTNIDVLNREIADITTQIDSRSGDGTGGPSDPGPGNGELDGGGGIDGSYSGTGGYVPPTMPQIDQAEARNRVRRDAPRIAFAQPRFGVGINIPLGT